MIFPFFTSSFRSVNSFRHRTGSELSPVELIRRKCYLSSECQDMRHQRRAYDLLVISLFYCLVYYLIGLHFLRCVVNLFGEFHLRSSMASRIL